MPRWTAAVGHRTAKILGIDLHVPDDVPEDLLGGAGPVFVEQPPTTAEFLRQHQPTVVGVRNYVQSLFPFASWIGYYNLQWFIGDLVAGITIGAVVVPQSLAYARLATLDVQFGLYSSFMGHLIYWIFGTSKDISIGPIAMMSVMTGKIIAELRTSFPDVPAHVIASSLAIVAGVFIVILGMIRCGWLIDLVPLVSLSAFVTGSAITIGAGQLASLLGVPGVKTSEPPAYVIISTLKRLPDAHGLDAAVGLTSLFLLYAIRYLSGRLAARFPARARAVFFAATLRTVVVILLSTLVSWLVNRDHRQAPRFHILMTVPAGFRSVGIPPLTAALAQKLVGFLPAAVIVLLLEHMAIAKAFGRIHNYTIHPSQEMVAIGAGNILGAFLGGYPATGSFSRTAIQAKAGSRSPACGLVTALVVLLAIYVLPPVFYYIPGATLGAVIVHAVGDLFTPPATLYRFWRIAPLEVPIFFAGVAVTVVSTIDMGIYTTVGLSVALLLVRNLKARGDFLGRVRVTTMAAAANRIAGDVVHPGAEDFVPAPATAAAYPRTEKNKSEASSVVHSLPTPTSGTSAAARDVFLPLGHVDGTNPAVGVDGSPWPGVFVYRFRENFNFPSAAHALAHLTAHVQARTRPGTDPDSLFRRPGDRPWNHPHAGQGGRHLFGAKKGGGGGGALEDAESGGGVQPPLPTLRAVVLDFSAVHHVDATSVQQLVDVRGQLDRFAAPGAVDWHFACVRSRWTRRALASAGFGRPTPRPGADGGDHRWPSIIDVAEIGGGGGGGGGEGGGVLVSEVEQVEQVVETKTETPAAYHSEAQRAAVSGMNRPFFHVDLTSALQSAILMARQDA